MILTVRQQFELDLPSDWRELPPAHVLESDSWMYEWVDEARVAVDLKESLLESLSNTASFALDQVTLDRSWVAIIDRSLGRVRAVASIVAIELTDDAFPDYWRIAEPDFPVAGVVRFVKQSVEARLGGLPAIVLHELGVFNLDEVGPVLCERYVGTVFPDASGTAVQLEILTADLGAFPDIVAAGSAVLDGLRFVSALD